MAKICLHCVHYQCGTKYCYCHEDEIEYNATCEYWKINPDYESDMLHEENEKLLHWIEEMQWISVSDRLPEDGQVVDVWVVANGLFRQRLTDVVYSSTSLTFQIDDICDVGTEPHPTNSFITHWMPLPKPPMGECSVQIPQRTETDNRNP